MRERRKQSRCPIPEIQDSDDYEAVVQAADSQQATNHSLSSRSQKRLRANHLLKLPQANLVTRIMPGIYDFKNGRKHIKTRSLSMSRAARFKTDVAQVLPGDTCGSQTPRCAVRRVDPLQVFATFPSIRAGRSNSGAN